MKSRFTSNFDEEELIMKYFEEKGLLKKCTESSSAPNFLGGTPEYIGNNVREEIYTVWWCVETARQTILLMSDMVFLRFCRLSNSCIYRNNCRRNPYVFQKSMRKTVIFEQPEFCGPIPEGHFRWTIRLLEEESKVILETLVGKVAIRNALNKTNFDLKKRQLVYSNKRSLEFIACTKDILDVYELL